MNEPKLYLNNEFVHVLFKDILCARALMETVSMFCRSGRALEEVKNKEEFIEWERKYAFSTTYGKKDSRRPDIPGLHGFRDPTNATTFIEWFSKRRHFVVHYYHILSEFCHPNGMGIYICSPRLLENNIGWTLGYALSLIISLIDDFSDTLLLMRDQRKRIIDIYNQKSSLHP